MLIQSGNSTAVERSKCVIIPSVKAGVIQFLSSSQKETRTASLTNATNLNSSSPTSNLFLVGTLSLVSICQTSSGKEIPLPL
jgi:hypothetical protein